MFNREKKLKIVTHGDKILSQQSKEVKKITAEEKKLIKGMFDIMKKEEGVGLAGNQVGVLKRIIVVGIKENQSKFDNGRYALINPKILMCEGEVLSEEGCLSFPEIKGNVKRSAKIMVKATDVDGKSIMFQTEALEARVIQHEVDHLDGIVFIDRMDEESKAKVLPKLKALESKKR